VTAALSRLDDLRSLVSEDCVGEREGRLVASPRTIEEVAGIARYANQYKLAIEIAGAGTKRGWGNPVSAEILLQTTGLVGVRAHSWQDLTATVAAGTPWEAMQRALAMHGQRVALDPLWTETATVGGIIATNDSGALRLKHGSLRDLIIGMTIVLADGTIAKSGGRVVKNVAGYDLHKLMIGAFGTLGVITEATFRLHPVPAQTKTWTISSPMVEPVDEIMMQVLDSQLSTQAMQLRAGAEGYALDIELATLPEVLAVQIEALDRLAAKSGPFDETARLRDCKTFEARQELFTAAGGVVIKATMLPSRIATLSSDVVRLGGSAVSQATGIMFARFSEEAASTALPSLRARVDAAGDGTLTVLRTPEGPLSAWANSPLGAEKAPALMREIKRQFDPNRTLNPGRFIGGI
jgi:glycolate dehydrogenase FAD-binding subunit